MSSEIRSCVVSYALPDVTKKLVYYISYFVESTADFEVIERQKDFLRIRWTVSKSAFRRVYEFITLPITGKCIDENKIVVTGSSTSFNFEITLDIRPNHEVIIAVSGKCSGDLDKCRRFVETYINALSAYVKNPTAINTVFNLPLPKPEKPTTPTPPTTPPKPPPTPPTPAKPEVKETPKPPTPPTPSRLSTPPPTTTPTQVKPEEKPTTPTGIAPAKPPVSPEEALDLVNLAMVLLKAPLVATLDLKPGWSVEDLIAFFVGESDKYKKYTYVIATLRSPVGIDISVLLDYEGRIVAWRGLVGNTEYDISEPQKLLVVLSNYTNSHLVVRIWGITK